MAGDSSEDTGYRDDLHGCSQQIAIEGRRTFMGCDIHSFAEVRKDGRWEAVGAVFPLDEFGREWHKTTHHHEPFRNRAYGVFGFLAGVRNYSDVPPLSEPKGFPSDASADAVKEYEVWEGDAHSASWLTLRELLSIDYDAEVEDRRITVKTGPNSYNGGATTAPGEGRKERWRDFLGQGFMDDLAALKSLGEPEDVRIVFWFDN